MTLRRPIPLESILEQALTGRSGTASSANHGHWTTVAGPAEWMLDPDQEGFWLVLTGDLRWDESAADPLAAAPPWPWPLKVMRREPGAPMHWCAELRLVGVPEEATRIREFVRSLECWLSDQSSPPPIAARERPEPPAPALTAIKELLVEALGETLQQTSRGYRLPAEDGPAIVIAPDRDWWVFRTTLVRQPGPLPAVSVASLHDYLAVANGRLRGDRARVDGNVPGNVPSAVLEAGIAAECLAVEAIRSTATGLGRAARLLAPVCQIVTAQPRVGEMYQRFLLGDRAATAGSSVSVSVEVDRSLFQIQ
jgi:hypothetical protein